jgi:hypothetical protein
LLEALSKKQKTKLAAQKVSRHVLDYLEALSPLLPIPGASEIAKVTIKKAQKGLALSFSLEARRINLARQLSNLTKPIVILIDELDRLEDQEIRIMAQLVRASVDFPQISYVLAYDAERVAEALGSEAGPEGRLTRGRGYLEKIVQHQIPLPVILNEELTSLAKAAIERIKTDLGLPNDWNESKRFAKLLEILLPGLLSTLRDIKHWIGLVHVQSSMFRGEVDWIDRLSWAALLSKAPQTALNIRRSPSRVCYGIGQGEFNRTFLADDKKTSDDLIAEICPPPEKSESLCDLLKFLGN